MEQEDSLISKMALKDDLLDSDGIVKYLDQNVGKFYKYFKNIKALLSEPANDENYNEAFQNFVKIIDSVPLMASKLETNIPVVRARPNYNGEIFSKRSELSYHPIAAKVTAGRFNAPGIPLFYGSLPVPDNAVDFSLTSCLESCKALISKTNPPALQDLTIGIWRTNQIVPVVNLCFDEQHLRTNQSLKDATDRYLELLKLSYSDSAYQFIVEFLNYFSELCRLETENNECYYILSALFAAIRYYYIEVMKVPFTGIIFPSCATEGIGLNTALVPPAVDYCLDLKKVGMQRFFLDRVSMEFISMPCCDLVDVIDGEFAITNYGNIDISR